MSRIIKSTEEKILEKDSQIEKLRERIKSDTEKIKKLEKDKENMMNAEIQGVMKEIDMPLADVIEMLKDLKKS